MGDPLERFIETLKAAFGVTGLLTVNSPKAGGLAGIVSEDMTIVDGKIISI